MKHLEILSLRFAHFYLHNWNLRTIAVLYKTEMKEEENLQPQQEKHWKRLKQVFARKFKKKKKKGS